MNRIFVIFDVVLIMGMAVLIRVIINTLEQENDK